MSDYKKILALALMVFWAGSVLEAQVKYQLELWPDGQTYEVSMVSEQDWEPPFNTVASAQVTLRYETGTAFSISDLTSLVPGTVWRRGRVVVAPEENQSYDYVSFGLQEMGARGFVFRKGNKQALFRFRNEEGCTGPVEIVDNASDPFLFPNSQRVKIANYISVAGAGGDAFKGVAGWSADCVRTSSGADHGINEWAYGLIGVYPNPVKDRFSVAYYLGEQYAGQEVYLILSDVYGRELLKENVSGPAGQWEQEFDIREYKAGLYQLRLEKPGTRGQVRRLAKVDWNE